MEEIEKIFAVSIVIHGDNAKEDEIYIDTTVQENAINFPTYAKLYRKIIAHSLNIANANSLPFRRTYAKEIKQRKLECRFAGNPNNRAKARKTPLPSIYRCCFIVRSNKSLETNKKLQFA